MLARSIAYALCPFFGLIFGASGAIGSENPKHEIRIGALLPGINDQAGAGAGISAGMEIAAKEINEAGGIERDGQGFPIKIIYADTQGSPIIAEGFHRLHDREQVHALVGDLDPGTARALALMASKNGLPLVLPTVASESALTYAPYAFRTNNTSERQGQLIAEYIRKDLNKEKTALLYVSDDLSSSSLALSFKKHFEALGGTITIEKKFQNSERNFTTYISEIESTKPDIIYAPISDTVIGLIMSQSRDTRPSAPFFGPDSWADAGLLKGNLTLFNGTLLTSTLALGSNEPMTAPTVAQGFMAAYVAANQSDGILGELPRAPGSIAVGYPGRTVRQGYDAVMLIVDAIKRAKTVNDPFLDVTRGSIRDALATTKSFASISGTLSIGSDNSAERAITILEANDGAFKVRSILGQPGQ